VSASQICDGHSSSARQARQTVPSQIGVVPEQSPELRQPTQAPLPPQCGVLVRAMQSSSFMQVSQRPAGNAQTGVAIAHSLELTQR